MIRDGESHDHQREQGRRGERAARRLLPIRSGRVLTRRSAKEQDVGQYRGRHSAVTLFAGREIRKAAEALGISIHEHLVIGRKGHASFRSLGLLS